MTLAKRTFFLSSAVLLAGAMGVAQTAMGGSSQDQDSSTAGQAAGAKLRGCLSGSSRQLHAYGSQRGAIYHLVEAKRGCRMPLATKWKSPECRVPNEAALPTRWPATPRVPLK